jgi:hypothetical protein
MGLEDLVDVRMDELDKELKGIPENMRLFAVQLFRTGLREGVNRKYIHEEIYHKIDELKLYWGKEIIGLLGGVTYFEPFYNQGNKFGQELDESLKWKTFDYSVYRLNLKERVYLKPYISQVKRPIRSKINVHIRKLRHELRRTNEELQVSALRQWRTSMRLGFSYADAPLEQEVPEELKIYHDMGSEISKLFKTENVVDRWLAKMYAFYMVNGEELKYTKRDLRKEDFSVYSLKLSP